MTYFSVIDFSLRHISDFCQASAFARRETGIGSTDGTPVTAHIPPARGQIPQSIANAQVFASRSSPQYSLRTNDLTRASTRYRNLSAYSPGQALSFWHSWQHCTQHTCRCQRMLRLQNIRRFCHKPDSDCSQTLRQQPPSRGIRADALWTRHDHHQSMLERICLGAVSQSQGGSQFKKINRDQPVNNMALQINLAKTANQSNLFS